jgi:glutamate-ammonia-ligase adenylyltransferase
MPVALQDLLAASPYLTELEARHGAWLAAALADAGAAMRGELAAVAKAGRAAADEAAVGAALRRAKGRIALLAAAAETGGQWTTAEATAALSDLADAALDAGLDLLLRRAHEMGDLTRSVTPAESGLGLLALGKHGGR